MDTEPGDQRNVDTVRDQVQDHGCATLAASYGGHDRTELRSAQTRRGRGW